MMRTKLLLTCAAALSMTTGCEVLIPLMIAANEGSGASDEYYEDGYYDDGMWGYEETELDVTVLEASGRVGDVWLEDGGLVVSGFLYGQSTNMSVRAAPAFGQEPADPYDPATITLDLCPIEDVLLNGADTTAFLALYACTQDTCLEGTYDMQVSVTEADDGVRTITVDSTLEDGSPVHLVLRYTAPL